MLLPVPPGPSRGPDGPVSLGGSVLVFVGLLVGVLLIHEVVDVVVLELIGLVVLVVLVILVASAYLLGD